MFCTKCGKEIPASTAVCAACGARRRRPSTPQLAMGQSARGRTVTRPAARHAALVIGFVVLAILMTVGYYAVNSGIERKSTSASTGAGVNATGTDSSESRVPDIVLSADDYALKLKDEISVLDDAISSTMSNCDFSQFPKPSEQNCRASIRAAVETVKSVEFFLNTPAPECLIGPRMFMTNVWLPFLKQGLSSNPPMLNYHYNDVIHQEVQEAFDGVIVVCRERGEITK